MHHLVRRAAYAVTLLGFMPAGLKADVKDLWSKKVSKNVRGSYGGAVAPHGVVMVRITPEL